MWTMKDREKDKEERYHVAIECCILGIAGGYGMLAPKLRFGTDNLDAASEVRALQMAESTIKEVFQSARRMCEIESSKEQK